MLEDKTLHPELPASPLPDAAHHDGADNTVPRAPKKARRYHWQAGLLSLLLLPALALAEPGFWHASKAGRNLWILGSIHAGEERFYPLPAVIDDAWRKADVLILETDLNNISASDSAQIAQMSQLPRGQSLKQVLPPALYQRTVSAAKQLGLAEASLQPMQPWVAAITLTQQALQKAGYQAELGVDHYYASAAARMGVPVRGLERVPEQFAYLAGLSSLQQDFLTATLDQMKSMDQEIPAMMQAWLDGDGPALQKLLSDEQASPALQEYLQRRLLKERNHNWIPKLLAMPEANQFLVVGALHLYGPDGILNLLRQQGYQLEVLTDSHE